MMKLMKFFGDFLLNLGGGGGGVRVTTQNTTHVTNLDMYLCDTEGLSTTWWVILSSDLGYGAPAAPDSSHETTPPKLRMTNVSASLGTSLARKNWQPLKRPCSLYSLASSSFTFFCSSASSGYNMMEKTRNRFLALPLLLFFRLMIF